MGAAGARRPARCALAGGRRGGEGVPTPMAYWRYCLLTISAGATLGGALGELGALGGVAGGLPGDPATAHATALAALLLLPMLEALQLAEGRRRRGLPELSLRRAAQPGRAAATAAADARTATDADALSEQLLPTALAMAGGGKFSKKKWASLSDPIKEEKKPNPEGGGGGDKEPKDDKDKEVKAEVEDAAKKAAEVKVKAEVDAAKAAEEKRAAEAGAAEEERKAAEAKARAKAKAEAFTAASAAKAREELAKQDEAKAKAEAEAAAAKAADDAKAQAEAEAKAAEAEAKAAEAADAAAAKAAKAEEERLATAVKAKANADAAVAAAKTEQEALMAEQERLAADAAKAFAEKDDEAQDKPPKAEADAKPLTRSQERKKSKFAKLRKAADPGPDAADKDEDKPKVVAEEAPVPDFSRMTFPEEKEVPEKKTPAWKELLSDPVVEGKKVMENKPEPPSDAKPADKPVRKEEAQPVVAAATKKAVPANTPGKKDAPASGAPSGAPRRSKTPEFKYAKASASLKLASALMIESTAAIEEAQARVPRQGNGRARPGKEQRVQWGGYQQSRPEVASLRQAASSPSHNRAITPRVRGRSRMPMSQVALSAMEAAGFAALDRHFAASSERGRGPPGRGSPWRAVGAVKGGQPPVRGLFDALLGVVRGLWNVVGALLRGLLNAIWPDGRGRGLGGSVWQRRTAKQEWYQSRVVDSPQGRSS